MPDPLLSSLCTICRVNPHKYRCPRCFILTCSLPCIKRHKQWAQCNGVRDPTKYMKRSDLATPKGIDHDYNYLTSIEREFDRAEKDALSRGLVLEEDGRRKKQPVKGETQFNAAIERCGVLVEKAPKGMTRSKQNETICSKKNRTLQWTVEWVHPGGNRTLDKLWETQTISTAYDGHLRYLDTSRPKKRRKPDYKPRDLATIATFVSTSVPVQDSTVGEQQTGSTTTASVGKRKREDDEANASNTEGEDPNMAIAVGAGGSEIVQRSGSIHASSNAPPVTKSMPKVAFNFYLHHPSLPSRHPVLIPLPPDARLASSLAKRLVLEFPTIYVFYSQPDGKLPEGFASEDDFFASANKGLIEEIAGVETSVGGFARNSEERTAHDLEDGEVNEGHLLEVLGKDLKGIAGSL